MRRSLVRQPWFISAALSAFTLVACPLAVLIASDCLSGDGREAPLGLGGPGFRTLEVHLAEPHPPTDYQSALRAPSASDTTAKSPTAVSPAMERVRVFNPMLNPPRYNASSLNPPAALATGSSIPTANSLGFVPATAENSGSSQPSYGAPPMSAPGLAPPATTWGSYSSGPPYAQTSPAIGQAAPAAANPAAPLKASDLTGLRDKVRQVLALYYPRHQNTRDNNPWEVIHAVVAYGVDQQLFKGGPGGEKVNAISWLCYNYPCAGYQMFMLSGDKIEGRRGVGVQGHAGQFLAYIAQSHLKSDYPMMVGGKQFTLADLIEQEKAGCVAGEELTFKLIGLSHYLDSDATWFTPDGQEWSIQRLIHEELKQPIRGAACGGTHRLMGFSYAISKRLQRGKPIVGEFARAQAFISGYHRYTFSLQNPDGSFSTEFFVRRGDSPDLNARLNSTGHILEWISFSLTDEELLDPRMVRAADYLANLMLNNQTMTWSIGPLGHGLHGLAIYHNRVFKDAEFSPGQLLVEGQGEEHREARRAANFSE